MSDFLEEHLREALRVKPAPDGFAERVMREIPHQRNAARRIWYAAIAALLVIALGLGVYEQQRERRLEQQLETQRQLVYALSLTVEKLQHVNAQLQQSAVTVKVENKKEEGRTGERL